MNSINIVEELLGFKDTKHGGLCGTHINACWYDYQGIKEQFPNLSQKEFENEIDCLRRNKYIEVDILSESNSILNARVKFTSIGREYYFDSVNKERVGY